jgi:hypothetical protein
MPLRLREIRESLARSHQLPGSGESWACSCSLTRNGYGVGLERRWPLLNDPDGVTDPPHNRMVRRTRRRDRIEDTELQSRVGLGMLLPIPLHSGSEAEPEHLLGSKLPTCLCRPFCRRGGL